MTRLFVPEELDRLCTPLSITLERAAAARDRTHLPWLVDQLNRECLAIYDAYGSWIGQLQRFIVERVGDVGHDLALTWVAEYGVRPFVRQFADLGDRERTERIAMLLRGAGSTFDVVEDAEKIRFQMRTWGPARWWKQPKAWQGDEPRHRVGDRYEYPCYGHYDGSENFPYLRGARPLTRGRDSLPSFLALEVLFLEIVPIELFGRPLAVIGLGDGPDDPVTIDVYKDGADVPQEAYDAVGLAKPAVEPGTPEPRRFHDEDLERLATPLGIRLEKAVEAEDWDEMRRLTLRMDEELVFAKDPLSVTIAGLLSWIARRFGEDGAEEALVGTAKTVMSPFIDGVRDLDSADSIRAWAIAWRAHGSTWTIEEEDDRFVFHGLRLGACARLWATADGYEVKRISDDRVQYPSFGAFQEPASFHVMRERRPITHGRLGYPVYSCHCVMLHEIYPIEQLGHPLWVETHPLEDPDAPTVHVHYKDPAAWPERYYEAVGKTKPVPVSA